MSRRQSMTKRLSRHWRKPCSAESSVFPQLPCCVLWGQALPLAQAQFADLWNRKARLDGSPGLLVFQEKEAATTEVSAQALEQSSAGRRVLRHRPGRTVHKPVQMVSIIRAIFL